VRMEIDSKPTELDEIDRRVMQLEIEREALRKEDDPASRERLVSLEQEIAQLKESSSRLRQQWEQEKRGIAAVRQAKQQIEEVRHQIEEAERRADLETAARLRYGTLPDLQRQLTSQEGTLQQMPSGRSEERRVGKE